MKRKGILLLLAIVVATMSRAAVPDFAYPQTVSKQAEVALTKALKNGNGVATVRALADLGLAQNAIGKEKLPAVVKRIEKIKNEERDSVTRSLLCMLLADIYADVYGGNRYVYDRREQPLLPLPENYDEWSGNQFRKKVAELCDEAMLPARKLQSHKLSEYKSIINFDDEQLIYYPTLYDFAALFTINKRKEISTGYENMLSRVYLTNWRFFVAMPKIVPSSAEAVSILKTYAEWLEFHKNSDLPFVNVDLQRLEFVNRNLYELQETDDDDENEETDDDDEDEDKLYELYRELYDKHSASEAGCDVLVAIYGLGLYNYDSKWLYNEMERAVAKFPAYHRVDCLKEYLTRMRQKNAIVDIPERVAPGIEYEIKVSSCNMPEVTFDFYKVTLSTPTDYSYKIGSGVEKPVKSVKVSFDGVIPFEKSKREKISFDEPGYYICRVRGESSGNAMVIRCSLLAIGAQGVSENTFFVFNPLNGVPVEGANVVRVENNRKTGVSINNIGLTDKNGFYKPKPYEKYCSYIASKNNDSYGKDISLSLSVRENEKARKYITGFTNLTLYHPGDTVKFVGVAYGVDGKKVSSVKGSGMSSVLVMPNGERVDTIEGVTDEFGRCSGEFVLPKGGLTGRARITMDMDGKRSDVWFTVSDYKLPTFEARVSGVLYDTPQKGFVTIKGVAESYTGVAVANAKVKMELGSTGRNYWRRQASDNFYSSDLTTDSRGDFTVEIPVEVFEYAPYPDGVFSARFTVTSPNGENRQCVREFRMKQALTLNVTVPQSINALKPVNFSVSIEDGEQKRVNQPVEYILMNDADSVLSKGSFMSNNAKINFENIPSGEYRLKFTTENANVDKHTIVIYRIGDKKSPVSSVLWSPSAGKRITVEGKGKCKVVVASDRDEQYCLYTLVDVSNGKIIEQKWVKLPGGVHEFEMNVPVDVPEMKAVFFAANNYKSSEISVVLENRELNKQMALVVESMRDKIVPGSEETIKLRSCEVGTDTTGVAGAMILNMWNKALLGVDGIVTPSLKLWINKPYVPSFSINQNLNVWNISASYNENVKRNFICKTLGEPQWELYGRSFRPYFVTDRMMMKATMATSAGVNIMRSESEVMPAYGSALKMDAAEESIETDADEGVLKESMTLADAVEIGNNNRTDEFVYREVETPSAFFAPMLKTDSKGKFEFSYIVPNANAQWVLQGLSFDERMRSANFETTLMAVRPIMVQSNLPRFMRYGDRAVIRATVSNKSDRNEEVEVVTEFFDVSTGKVVQHNDTTVSVNSDESATVGVSFVAPDDRTLIGYRVKATAGMYADGEQQILPLLPFITPVVETKLFYLSADSMRMQMRLPDMKGDAEVTLQFCENPAWYVVTALPGLQKGSPQTSVEAADMIFSASVARGILKKYPAVKEALDQWLKQPGDSMLRSMLERNNDLKIMLLSSTPWMADAENDTERMARLALLFNEKEIDSTLDSAWKLLRKLHSTGEGWAWHPSWNEPDSWATMEVLTTLGQLQSLGFLSADKEAKQMVKSSIDWLQSRYVAIWKKNRNGVYTNYVSMRDLWPQYAQNAQGKQLTAETVQKLLASWKKSSIAGKAEAAMILSAHGYKSVAREILRSINEYAVVSEQSGMHWPSVSDAMSGSVAELAVAANLLKVYNLLEPGCKEIDLIRQWLVVQKETRNWGNSAMVSEIIAVFLGCGSDWTVPAKGTVISLNGKTLGVSPADNRLGAYRIEMKPTEVSGAHLEIEKSGKTPAWGAVYCRYRAVTTEVSAQSCDGLSISKRMFKLAGTEWVETDRFSVGDRVRIQLIVKADRALDYVAITDDRAACFEPVEQLPGWMYSEGIGFYRENRDAATNIFVNRMPKGTYLLSYEVFANNSGDFASGLATAQSQYAPQITAHSGGSVVAVAP